MDYANPGDAGSSLGAPALYYFEAQVTLSIGKVYLGTNIKGQWPHKSF